MGGSWSVSCRCESVAAPAHRKGVATVYLPPASVLSVVMLFGATLPAAGIAGGFGSDVLALSLRLAAAACIGRESCDGGECCSGDLVGGRW